MSSGSLESITSWHSASAAGFPRSEAVPTATRQPPVAWRAAAITTDADDAPAAMAASRATRPNGSSNSPSRRTTATSGSARYGLSTATVPGRSRAGRPALPRTFISPASADRRMPQPASGDGRGPGPYLQQTTKIVIGPAIRPDRGPNGTLPGEEQALPAVGEELLVALRGPAALADEQLVQLGGVCGPHDVGGCAGVHSQGGDRGEVGNAPVHVRRAPLGDLAPERG